MGERRFIIEEVIDSGLYQTITESELKRRLAYIAGWPVEEMGSMTRDIDVILHGEGEKKEESQFAPKDISPYTRVFGIADHPSHIPTRAEWEEWADSVSKIIWWSNADGPTVKKALLSMPIVPKGG